jgi:hypothetical protein
MRWMRSLFHKQELERQLDKELRFHFESRFETMPPPAYAAHWASARTASRALNAPGSCWIRRRRNRVESGKDCRGTLCS